MSLAPRGVVAAPGRLLAAGALLGFAVVGLLVSWISPDGAIRVVQLMLELLRGAGAEGAALFIALQILVALSGAVPSSLLGLAAGALYGLVPGFSLAAVGNLAGAVIAFGLSRSLCRPAVERAVARYRRLHNFDVLLSQDGRKMVCLLRLSPIMPFSVTSYLLGLSAVSFSDYLAGTLASLAPLFCYVLLGTLSDAGLAAWTGGGNMLRWVLFGAGGVATLLLLLHIGRLALQRQLGLQLADQGGGCGE